jgi:protein involved in polysaccharide export with SLBB domain
MAALALLFVLLCCGGCYNHTDVNAFLANPPRPVAIAEYRVYPPDQLLISSDNMHEFKAELGKRGMIIDVKPDGKVNLPLLGEVYVAGKTLKEIEKEILKAASVYYSEATCDLDILQYNSQKYYVFGQVNSPGPKAWSGRDSVIDALSISQPTELAWVERIVIVRAETPRVGGHERKESKQYVYTGVNPDRRGYERKRMVVNMMAMIRSGDMSGNVLLHPGDIVYVQPTPLARLGILFRQIGFPLREASTTVRSWREIADKDYYDGVWNDSGSGSR